MDTSTSPRSSLHLRYLLLGQFCSSTSSLDSQDGLWIAYTLVVFCGGSNADDVCHCRVRHAPVYVETNHGEALSRQHILPPGVIPTWKSRDGQDEIWLRVCRQKGCAGMGIITANETLPVESNTRGNLPSWPESHRWQPPRIDHFPSLNQSSYMGPPHHVWGSF